MRPIHHSASFHARAVALGGALMGLVLSVSACDTEEPEPAIEGPVVTGIYVTTLREPSGTGEVLGDPSYLRDGALTPVPNPYIGATACPPSFPDCGWTPERRVYFPGVPSGYEVRLFRAAPGRAGAVPVPNVDLDRLVADSASVWSGRMPSEASGPGSGALIWGFSWSPADERSGLFRAVLLDTAGVAVTWADLYVIHPDDYETWVDSTGWLPSGWRP